MLLLWIFWGNPTYLNGTFKQPYVQVMSLSGSLKSSTPMGKVPITLAFLKKLTENDFTQNRRYYPCNSCRIKRTGSILHISQKMDILICIAKTTGSTPNGPWIPRYLSLLCPSLKKAMSYHRVLVFTTSLNRPILNFPDHFVHPISCVSMMSVRAARRLRVFGAGFA